MEKNNKPYSEPHNLQLAFASDFNSIAIIRNRWYGNFKPDKKWISIPEVPGTLKPSCISNELTPPIYTINTKFRVSYESEENQREIESWTKGGVIARYCTGSGKEKVSGSMTHALTFSFSKVEGFDGYECTLKGSGTSPESFV